MPRYLSFIFLACISLLAAGCQFDPYAGAYTHIKPRIADLAGTYAMTQETKADVWDRGNYPQGESRVVLRVDGSIILENIPDWWLTDFAKPGGALLSGTGTWTIQRHFILGDPDSGDAMEFER